MTQRILPDNTFLKYYSSNDAMVIIGDVFVDEAVSVSYSVRDSKIPIYSYNSPYFKRVAPGKIIVQGTITINYIDDNYFLNILREGQNKAVDKNSRINTFNFTPPPIFAKLLTPNLKLDAQDVKNLSTTLATNPQARQDMLAKIRIRKAEIRDRNLSNKGILIDKEDSISRVTNFNLFHNMGPVKILVSHQNPLVADNSVARIIDNVYIIGLEHAAQPTGQPQVETYSFFAERVY